MIKKTAPLLAVLLAAGVAGAIAEATAHTSKSHGVNQSGRWAIIKSSNGQGPPQKGKYQLYAGTLSGPPGGKGAIIFRQVFASNFGTPPNAVSITGTATFFEPDGSYRGAISGTTGPHGPKATVTITKGFGLYRGATGKVKLTGPGCPITAPCSITITGSIKY